MSGNDIYSKCLAVDEYRTLSWCRTAYRAVLHPVISLMLPPLVFLVIDPDVALRRLTSSRYCLWDEKRRNWQKSRTHE
jgi:hypothetical protein